MLGKRKRPEIAPPPKKRKKSTSSIEEITFDFSAREDYLSGFHKRKLQRIKHAQEEAAKKEREDKIAARKLLRDARKSDLERHVAEVNALLRKADPDSGEASSSGEDDVQGEAWDGIPDLNEIDQEAEYEDEDRHTTVTIEAVDVTREGLQKVVSTETLGSGDETESQGGRKQGDAPVKVKRKWTKERPEGPKQKKKKKFRYENKAERKVTRYKERSGGRAKAKARRE